MVRQSANGSLARRLTPQQCRCSPDAEEEEQSAEAKKRKRNFHNFGVSLNKPTLKRCRGKAIASGEVSGDIFCRYSLFLFANRPFESFESFQTVHSAIIGQRYVRT